MTTGNVFTNEWDPGDPLEILQEWEMERRKKMATRGIALGRIIDWAKNADMEEVHFVLSRMGTILSERRSRVESADAHGKVKRTRRATKKEREREREIEKSHILYTDEAEHLDAPAGGKTQSA